MLRKNITDTVNNTPVEKPKRGRPRKITDASIEVLAKKKTPKPKKDGSPRKAYTKKAVEPIVETPAQKVFVVNDAVPIMHVPVRVNTETLELPSIKHSKLVTVLMWLGLVGFAIASMALANMLLPLWVEQLKMVGIFR